MVHSRWLAAGPRAPWAHLENAGVAEQQVGRLEVAVQDPVVVQMLHTPQQLDHQRLHLPCGRQATATVAMCDARLARRTCPTATGSRSRVPCPVRPARAQVHVHVLTHTHSCGFRAIGQRSFRPDTACGLGCPP